MNNINILILFRFLFIIISQILIFNNLLIFGVSPNIYLIFLIIFPLNYNKSLMYLCVFIAGLVLDSFSNSYGVITFSLLLSSILRPYFLKFSFGHFDASKVRKTADYIRETSLYQKVTFLVLMYFSHQLILYSVEAFSLEKFSWVFKKTILSTIISIILTYILILIFFNKNAR
jgi:rod shape-determining protein MreD